ncbi:MAG: rod shape-determining protein [bacterium]
MFNIIENIKKIKLPFFSNFQLYIDFGTSNTRIGIKDKGVVLNEPTILGLNTKTNEYLFFGQEAKKIIGKVPDFIKIIKPTINGTINDFDGQLAFTKRMIEKTLSPYIKNYSLMMPSISAIASVPYNATEIEQRALEEVLNKAGVSYTAIIEKPVATAIGCGFNIFEHNPVFVVDMGGGLIEMAILSGGGVVVQKTIKYAGENMNKLIYNYLYLKNGIILGETTCEDLKMKLLNFEGMNKTIIVRGKSLETGLPKSVKITTTDIQEALSVNFNQILDGIKELVEQALPEIVDEVFDKGIILTGGVSNVPSIEKFFSEELKIKVKSSDNPNASTVNGLIRIGRKKEMINRLKITLP